MTISAQLEAHIAATGDEIGKLAYSDPHSVDGARFMLASLALKQLQDRHTAVVAGQTDPEAKLAASVPKSA